jgi:signal transduction histidine kinase
LNGEVAQSKQAVIVNDVSQDPRYLAMDGLPDTRSELVVPLRVGDRVIGTLDVQSSELNAFSEEDQQVVQSLGDQVAVAIENARLYERSRELGVLEERNRLARELHDSVTQSLYAVSLYGDATDRQLKSGQVDMAAENVRKLRSTAREALGEMRLLVFELRPPILQEEGLVTALETRLEAVERRVGLQTAFHVEGKSRPPPEVEEGLYRIALEALNNALKHAGARSITVSLKLDPRTASVEVVDDGIGFDPMAGCKSGGMGLRGMAERAEQMGGRLNVESEPGVGTTVRVEVDQ